MLRAGLGLLLVLACAGCAANDPPNTPAPACQSHAGEPDAQDCSEPSGITVHVGGTVSYGMGVR